MKSAMHGYRRLLLFVSYSLVGGFILSCGGSRSLYSPDIKDLEFWPLPESVNSVYDDYAPVFAPSGDGLVFTSNRPPVPGADMRDDIYIARYAGGVWQEAAHAIESLPGADNRGAASYDELHGIVYFGQCYRPDGVGDCDLYAASVEGNRWSDVRNLGPVVNSLEWDAHPFVTPDGSQLYFASERLGGFGGSDLYVCYRQPDGTWGKPVNLGKTVNSGGDEKSPFYSPAKKKLYFASDGHDGMGGFDIFVSKKTVTGWSKPVNVGAPVNSDADDIFFAQNVSGDTSFVASNRPGGRGGFDIYAAIRKAPPPPKEPPPVTRLQLSVLNEFTRAPVVSTLIIYDENDTRAEEQTNADGVYVREVRNGASYRVTALAPGFNSRKVEISIPADTSGLLQREILLTPVREKERVIYKFFVEFDFDRFRIRPEEQRHLDSVVQLLMKYPNSSVIVAGHTDSVGSVGYNLTLSYNRAKRVSAYVKEFLSENGIALENPLEIRAYGESQPIAPNSTEEGRQRNRRVEILIVRNE